ncbi:hypothetical protein B0I35DRAFT_360525 [Stachybotrys elegans]|uniref:Rhodopsin domain-containing protein n=1 Tax=Stachybotrys elegans TaxID=80388 RepID=A0A8K0SLU0_9HYPO|nr:hypothetical protein B0I35DRAFT_360525 [Stachybotrys elegans]
MDTYRPGANPDDLGRGPMIVGIVWTLTILAMFVIGVRLYARKKLKSLSWDDWIMAAALCIQLVDNSFMMVSYSYGMGKHDADMTLNQIINAVKWGWLWTSAGIFVATLARVSCSIFLIRIFGIRKWFKWYLIGFTFLQCCAAIALFFVTFLGVQPIEALWNPFVTANASLTADVSIYMAYFTQALFTWADLTYVLLPVIFIWKLQMGLPKRIGLMAVLLISLITVAASILKATRVQNVSSELSEPQYAASIATLLSGMEQTLVMLLGSIPAACAVSKLHVGFFSRLDSYMSSCFSHRGTSQIK